MTTDDRAAVRRDGAGAPATGPTPGRGRHVRDFEPGAVHVAPAPSGTRIVLSGEIDAELGPDLMSAADDALSSPQPIEVDSHRVTFMDSTGVAFLARLASRAPDQVRLLDPPDLVTFLIETTRIASLLDVVHRDDARSSGAREG